MDVYNKDIAAKLQEILSLQSAIKLQENKYASLLKADKPFEILKGVRLKIKYLKVELKAKEEYTMTLFQSEECLHE